MKRICWVVYLIFLMTLNAAAQSWHIGVNGGGVWNTKTTQPWDGEHSSAIGGVAGLRLGYEKNRWEAGLSADFRRYSLRYSSENLRFEDQFDPATGTLIPSGSGISYPDYIIASIPSLTISPYLRYHFFRKQKLDIYAGASLGYCILFEKKRGVSDFAIWNMKKGADAFSPGLHVGAAYPLWHKLYIEAELTGTGVFSKPMAFFATAATVGLQYRFH